MTLQYDKLAVDQGEMPLAIATAGGKAAAIVILPSAFGIACDLEAQMEELALEASVVVALDKIRPPDRRRDVRTRPRALPFLRVRALQRFFCTATTPVSAPKAPSRGPRS
jgi:hypothetical protein